MSAPDVNKTDIRETLQSLWQLEKIILNNLDFRETVNDVVNNILFELERLYGGYKVAVLALVDEKSKSLKRVSLSQTVEARKTREVSDVPFDSIVTPLSAKENLCIKAMLENKPQITHYFPDILTPPVSVENALESQRNAHIETSLVYPLSVRNKTIGVMIFSLSKDEKEISDDEKTLIAHLTDLVAMAVQNSRLYSILDRESREIAVANEKLKSLDNLKDEFLSIATHELRTPMTIIKSYIWMLQQEKGGSLTEKQKEYLGKAYTGVERMIKLVNDMLDVSRIEQGKVDLKMNSVCLRDLIHEFIDEFKIKTDEKGLYLHAEISENLPCVYGDLDKIREVLTNLMGNSIKFTETGGLTIKTEQTLDGEIKTSIVDTGKGIRPEDTKRLFQRFERVGNSYTKQAETPGTGLGLYISKNYVEKMGGKIGVFSDGEGTGTTFWFTLPIFTNFTESELRPVVDTHTSFLRNEEVTSIA
jgi:signal transduction histidine kinase